jgi:DNA helicase IV
MLYDRLDALRRETTDLLSRVWRDGGGGTHQARSERDASATLYSNRLAQVNAVEGGLCFGRLDLVDGERLYIGRLGLFDEENDYEPLLIDWRAAAARPFYCATAASPEGVLRRRHLYTKGRVVTGFDDDVFDLDSLTDRERGSLAGEAALLAALDASRTGRMRDIVATIQAEQDRVIRADRDGVLVVQGGPGTGKTAVALHRAGYLLYTHRETLSRRGVLIVGPNATFLRYIDRVLPSLGETDALLRTVGELYPGLVAAGCEPAEVAAVKGRPEMARVIAAAVRDRQEVPDGVLELAVAGHMLRLDPAVCRRARARARASRRLHNAAREVFEEEIIAALAKQAADQLGAIVPSYEEIPLTADEHGFGSLFDADDLAEIRHELRSEPEVRATLDRLWPRLTPQDLLTELYASPSRLASAFSSGFSSGVLSGPGVHDAEWALLGRAPGMSWTPADVPLLDEAAELLGTDDAAAAARAAEQARRELAYAKGVMEVLDLPETATAELLRASDVLDARHLAARHHVAPGGTTAERAAADRRWTFGHVIVDEAQELSAMAWRVLMRRCPIRSMTIVGDIAQTGALAGTTSWADVLDPFLGDRWRLAELTVNYRTPAEAMAVAADVLATVDPSLVPPASVRSSGVAPWCLQIPAAELSTRLGDVVALECTEVGDGKLAVIVPATQASTLGATVAHTVPDTAAAASPTALERRVVVLTVEQVKGLEFDSVIIVEPAEILTESARGARDLYVALTRTTRRLGVVHTGELPAVLRRLSPR